MSNEPLLEIVGVSKHFGGLAALEDVNLTLERGPLYAIIGPNGAGKTTLFNIISGSLRPTHGNIVFMGRKITGMPVHRISQLGLARTLQVKSVFSGLTVRENLWTAVQSRRGVFRPFTGWRRLGATAARVEELLVELELEHLADQKAANLSYGDVALLEIGIALATEPKLLLLDEPICGMGPAETARTVDKIRDLSKGIDVVIIEHDIEVVFNLADEIVCMSQGRVLARGTPDQISNDQHVRNAYLGEPDDA